MNKTRLCILAGEGKMPIYIANKAIERGYDVYALCLKGNAKESDYKMCTACEVVRLGQMGAAFDFFKKNGITELVIAGRVQHTSVFTNLFPDKRGAKFLATLKSMQTSHILSRLIEEFRKEGIEVKNSALFLDDFFPKKGVLSQRKPTEGEQKTIDYGFSVAKEIARLDIGLTCVVGERAVIAVEGMEGTDRCIERAGELYKRAADKPACVAVVKVSRPQQDNRFDLPVIGKGTLKSMHKAGFSVLAFEAEKTLVMDLDEVVELADKWNVCLCAV